MVGQSIRFANGPNKLVNTAIELNLSSGNRDYINCSSWPYTNSFIIILHIIFCWCTSGWLVVLTLRVVAVKIANNHKTRLHFLAIQSKPKVSLIGSNKLELHIILNNFVKYLNLIYFFIQHNQVIYIIRGRIGPLIDLIINWNAEDIFRSVNFNSGTIRISVGKLEVLF